MANSEERSKPGHRLGIHRVLDREPRLPQSAERLDNTLPIYSNEVLIRVERLNIDAASFVQMEEETGKDPDRIANIILENCRSRGKQQNRITGSGGMLIGTIEQGGPNIRGKVKLKPGDRVATLVSLTLTPLHLDFIQHVNLKTHQVDVSGHAILFESGVAARLPKDMPEPVAMAVYDVCGAPALVSSICRSGQRVVVVGAGGKAGILSCVAGRQKIGRGGKLIAIEPNPSVGRDLQELGVCTEVLSIDATDPVAVHAGIERATRGKMGDVVINVASCANTEIGSILSAKPRGKVIFFSMATSFTKVALGAEGVASTATLLFGNGYYPDHSEFALSLLRTSNPLKDLFYRRYNS